MGRKKIQISRITDERNRQVNKRELQFKSANKCISNFSKIICTFELIVLSGYIQQTQIWCNEKGIRIIRTLRLRNSFNNIFKQ